MTTIGGSARQHALKFCERYGLRLPILMALLLTL
jgi:hypothetical protein